MSMPFMQSTCKERVLRKTSPDEEVLRLSITRAFDDKAHRNMIVGDRLVADGSNRMRMALGFSRNSVIGRSVKIRSMKDEYGRNHLASNPCGGAARLGR